MAHGKYIFIPEFVRCAFFSGVQTRATELTRMQRKMTAEEGNKFNLHRASDKYKNNNSTETYGGRSKRWTNQFRKLIPYSEVRCDCCLFFDERIRNSNFCI